MRKIKVVVLLVQQLQHGFTKNAKVSPNLTVAHIAIGAHVFWRHCCNMTGGSNIVGTPTVILIEYEI